MYIKKETRRDVQALVRKLVITTQSTTTPPLMYANTIQDIINLHMGIPGGDSRDTIIERIARKVVQAGDDTLLRDRWETLALYLPDFHDASSQVRQLVRESQERVAA